MYLTFFKYLSLYYHCVKSVQRRSFFWSVFSRIWSRKNSVFAHFSRSVQVTELFTLEGIIHTRGPLASRPDYFKLPARKTRKPRGENAENSLIFYCEFKTVLTDQVRANNHKYKYAKSKQLNIRKG